MPGTPQGGIKARDRNRERHGDDFYQKLGHLGGSTPTKAPKGFAANPALASEAGRKGGTISRRRKAVLLKSEQETE